MRMPKLAETRLYTKRLDSFGGIRRVGQVRDGEFSDAVNLTNDDYPYLKTRKYRLIMDKAGESFASYPVNGIFEMPSFGSGLDGLGVVRGQYVLINGQRVWAGVNLFELDGNAQDIVMMGAYALFFPAKKYLNLSRLYSVPAGLRSDDYGDVTCPDMDIIMSSGNRLWGAKYGNVEQEGAMVTVNEIYASKLGDFNTWTTSSETSTSAGDPYTVSIGAPGYFTGACELNNKPVFFKEDYIISIYGTEPANFQVRTDEAEGVRLGCARTVSVSNGAAYYVGKHGVYVYGGGTPVLISEELGDSGDGMRQAQAERYSIFNGAGSGAVFNGKYYVNARLFPESFERFTFVYDIGRRSWQRVAHETDDTAEAINSFIVLADYLLFAYRSTTAPDSTVYGITNHQDAVPVADEDVEQTDGVPFAAVTGRIGYETHDHKALSRVTVRMRVGAGDGRKIRYSLNYDDEKDANEATVWRDVHEIAAAPIRTFTLSVRPRRCDHFQMKIEGRGDVEVYSVEYVYEYGSDLANHILN